jgi:hypothetical protein
LQYGGLKAKVQHNTFIHQQSNGEAEGTQNTAAAETPVPLAATPLLYEGFNSFIIHSLFL